MKPIEFPASFFESDEDTDQLGDLPQSEAEASDPDTEDEDTLSDADLEALEDSDSDDEDTDEEDAWDETDEEAVNEGEEEDAEDEEEDSEADAEEAPSEEEEGSFLPPFDRRKLLKEHPELEVPYKHMQAAFTRKTQELAEVRTEAEALRGQLTDFVESLSTEEGAVEFLERMALGRPDVFQKVVERFEETLSDDDAREKRVREISLKDREKQLEQKEQLEQAKQQQARIASVVQLAEATSEEEGLTDEDSIAIAKQFVLAKIHENKAKTGVATISDEEVVAAVRSAGKHVRAQMTKAEKQAALRQQQQSKQNAKAKLKQSKKPRPAGTKSAPPVPKKPKVPAGMDPVHYALQKRLGLLD